MQIFRAILRAIGLTLLLISHICWALLQPILHKNHLPYALRVRQVFVRRSLILLGVKIDMEGTPPEGPHIYVGNHRSYIDPIVTLRDVSALPVAKAEVARWPLIGYGAKVTGIMFVKRESKSSRGATLEAMSRTLQMGYSVLVYPEGTTHVLPHTMEFRAGAFSLAVKEGVPVVPMAIEYLDLGDAWVGDDTFIPHFLRCFGKRRTFIKIRYGEPILFDDPQALMAWTRSWIDENLAELRAEFDEEISNSISNSNSNSKT